MRLVIIGNGVAGITTARYVAEWDPSIEISLYGQEPHAYYPRPRLIDFMANKLSLEELPQYDAAWYQERRIAMHLGCQATSLDPKGRTVTMADGRIERYDQLVLATGARPWIPPIPGATQANALTLRTLDDAQTLFCKARQGLSFVILGGGLLGLDAAMALHSHGVDVTVIEALPRLLPRQLDLEGADLLQRIVESRGVRVITGETCAQIEGNGHVQCALLQSRRTESADVVLVSAGVRPDLDLARAAGLATNRGIVVDERMQTSEPGIYAVGDAAEFGGKTWGIIPVALAQARVAAAQLAGRTDTVYREVVPSTTLQVTGIDLTSLGEVNPVEGEFREVRQMNQAARTYKKLVIREGRVVGAILLGSRSDLGAVNHLVSRGVDVAAVADRLLEPDFDLAAFARVGTARPR